MAEQHVDGGSDAMPSELESTTAPRYVVVAKELREAIRSGNYRIGDAFPTETQLQERFNTSRFTIREALRLLERDGLIDRSQGRSTRVAATEPPPVYLLATHSDEDVLRYASETSIEFSIAQEYAPAEICERLRLDSSVEWTQLRGLRRTAQDGDSPIALTDVYLPAEYRGIFDTIGFHLRDALFVHVSRAFGITLSHIDQTISATVLDDVAAHELDSTAGEVALRVVRRFIDDSDKVFEVSVSLHPADRFEYSVQLSRARPTESRSSASGRLADLARHNGVDLSSPADELERLSHDLRQAGHLMQRASAFVEAALKRSAE